MFPPVLCYDELMCVLGQVLHSDTLDVGQRVDPVWDMASLDSAPAQAVHTYWAHTETARSLFMQRQWAALNWIATLTPALERDMFPSFWDLCCAGDVEGIRWIYKTFSSTAHYYASNSLRACCWEGTPAHLECARLLCEVEPLLTLADLPEGGLSLARELGYYNDRAIEWLEERFGLVSAWGLIPTWPPNPPKRRKLLTMPNACL